ncbi:MAG: hypothetical protein ABEJ42_06580 [Halobacteriaceae archaeon]
MGRDEDGFLYLLTVGVPDKSNRFQYGAGQVLKVVPPGTQSGPLPTPTSV